jgi:hypothetical protein
MMSRASYRVAGTMDVARWDRPPSRAGGHVLHFCHMSQTITIRLTRELAAWLEQVSNETGLPQGRIVRDQLEKARARSTTRSFMRLAGVVRGARDLSTRKGFSRP